MRANTGRRPLLAGGTASLVVSGMTRAASAQVVDRQTRLILNVSAGNVTDAVARLYAEQLHGLYARQVIVDNRPGAAGRLGIEAAKTAPADGTSFLMTPETMMVVYPFLYTRTLRYDPQRDFIPVTGLSSFGFAWMVDAAHPATDFQSFLEWARDQAEVPYASPALGSTPHFLSVEMARRLNLPLVHVTYREAAMMLADLNGGRIRACITVIGTAAEQHRAGRVRILAVSAPHRVPSLPAVPTFAELGHSFLTADEWYGVFLPVGTPAPIVEGLHGAIAQVAQTAKMHAALARLEQNPVDTTPAEFAARLAGERDRWAPVIKASGYTVEDG